MKKLIAIFLTLTFLLFAVSCESKNQSSTLDSSSETVNTEEKSMVKLTNHMTDKELQNTKVGELTVFDYEQKKIPEDGVYLEYGLRINRENIGRTILKIIPMILILQRKKYSKLLTQ